MSFIELYTAFKTASVATKQQAAQDLSIWIQKYLQSPQDSVVTSDEIFKLFQTACENLTDAKPGYTNTLKELIRNTIALKQKLYPQDSFEPWIRYLVTFPATSKALYHALEPLAKFIPGPFEYGINDHIYKTAFTLFVSLHIASPVGKCLSALLQFRGTDRKDPEQISDWLRTWSPYVYSAMSTKCRENVLIYVLNPLLRQNPFAFKQFYEKITAVEDQIGCLKVANDCGIDVEPYIASSLTSCLHNRSRFLRFEVLALVVASRHVSKPVPQAIYNTIRENANVLFCEANPKFRNQVFAVMRKFLFRIRQSTYAANRDHTGRIAKQLIDPRTLCEPVEEAKKFLNWLFEYSLQFLVPGCPYRCLATGFQYIDLMAVNGLDERVDRKYFEFSPVPFPFSIDLFTVDLLRLLINNVPNDYYDVRQMAAKLIQMAPRPIPFLETAADVAKLTTVARTLLSGIRGRQGDGGARISQIAYLAYPQDSERIQYLESLVQETSTKVDAAAQDIRAACQQHGLHGYFQALALIFEAADFDKLPPQMVPTLIDTVLTVWDITWDTLTNSAPEGNIPMPLDAMIDGDDNDVLELSGKHGATAQVLLSFSWRAVKESTTLLTVLIERYPSLQETQIRNLMDILVRQLTSIRHRGAYSSIAPAYEALCKRCYESQNLAGLPLQKVMAELELVITKTQLITRRSAGLPMLISGAIAMHPDQKQVAQEIMQRLHDIATIPISVSNDSIKLDLPQVHAFNCLRGALRESRLTKSTDPYVESSLVLAIEAFSSPIWSIRNCGVMLFSTLYIRLFGSSSTMGAGVFFNRFKTIQPLLYNHLVDYSAKASSADLETIYPILALLLRLRSIGENSGLEEFCDPILQFLSSEIWKVREMSAWVLAAILHPSQIEPISFKLLNGCTTKHQNTLHGHLMAINAIGKLPDGFAAAFKPRLSELLEENPCFETKNEAVKLAKTLGLPLNVRFEAIEVSLNPSVRVYNSLIVDPTSSHDYAELLKCGQRDVVEVVLERLISRTNLMDEQLHAALVDLLREPVPSVKAAVLDVMSHLRSQQYSLSYNEVAKLLYNPLEPQCVQQRALKCLGSLVPDDTSASEKWEATIEEWSSDEMPLDSRLCALESIKAYLQFHLPSDRLLWNLYMLLSDDDETVRTVASEVCSLILHGDEYAPRYCEPLILSMIKPEYVRDRLPRFDENAVSNAESRDETLFMTEKSNLYRNEYAQIAQIRQVLGMRATGLPEGEPLGASANGDLQIALAWRSLV